MLIISPVWKKTFFFQEGFWGQPEGPNFPSPRATTLALHLDCPTAALTVEKSWRKANMVALGHGKFRPQNPSKIKTTYLLEFFELPPHILLESPSQRLLQELSSSLLYWTVVPQKHWREYWETNIFLDDKTSLCIENGLFRENRVVCWSSDELRVMVH